MITPFSGAEAPAAPATPAMTPLDQAFAALRQYTRGSGRGALLPLDQAVVAALPDAEARKTMEQRLVAALTDELPLEAREYVCRKLGLVGSVACVTAVAKCLGEPQLSPLARQVLEVVPASEAAQALRQALPKLEGMLKVGVVQSLGRRRDLESVPLLEPLLRHEDATLAGAAAAALGELGNAAAARALTRILPQASAPVRLVVADACLACAERLLAERQEAEAQALYEALSAGPQPPHVQQAVARQNRK